MYKNQSNDGLNKARKLKRECSHALRIFSISEYWKSWISVSSKYRESWIPVLQNTENPESPYFQNTENPECQDFGFAMKPCSAARAAETKFVGKRYSHALTAERLSSPIRAEQICWQPLTALIQPRHDPNRFTFSHDSSDPWRNTHKIKQLRQQHVKIRLAYLALAYLNA